MPETLTPRSPAAVLAEIQNLHFTARSAFVPASVTRAIELQAEFDASVVDALERLEVRMVGAELFAVDQLDSQADGAADEQPAG